MEKSDLYGKQGGTKKGKEQYWMPQARDKRRRPDFDKGKKKRDKFYGLGVWTKTREKKLNRDPLCERCKELGKIAPANIVHHVRPILDGGDRLALENLRSLCTEACHAAEHAEIERKRRKGKLDWDT